ncbi:MAG: hypothetical protein K5657_09765 [Desulfovibrio sp.]|nr:hypothetical protein [Desulfovibrio sp.]
MGTSKKKEVEKGRLAFGASYGEAGKREKGDSSPDFWKAVDKKSLLMIHEFLKLLH